MLHATALRRTHYALKRFAADLDADAGPHRILGRSAFGPTWQYGEEPDLVRYTDGQVVTLADGRAIVLTVNVVFEADSVTVHGDLTVGSETGDDESDFDPELITAFGPRTAHAEDDIIALIDTATRDLTGRYGAGGGAAAAGVRPGPLARRQRT